jgi:hypothetical protein
MYSEEQGETRGYVKDPACLQLRRATYFRPVRFTGKWAGKADITVGIAVDTIVPAGNLELHENLEFVCHPSAPTFGCRRCPLLAGIAPATAQSQAALHAENLALRLQLGVLRRSVRKPQSDRLRRNASAGPFAGNASII